MGQVSFETPRAFKPLLQPARYKGAYGGRGSAKSWFFAAQVVQALMNGRNVACLREIQDSIKDSSKRLIENIISEKGIGHLFNIKEREIVCIPTNALCIFRGMQDHTAESVKSLEGFDVAWWEEAQTASMRSLEILIPTIRKDGSELWFSWNPTNSDDPVDVLLRKAVPEGAIVVAVSWRDNPWFPEVLRGERDRLKTHDPARYLHVWEGEYRTVSDAQIIRNSRKAELNPPANVIWYYGLDFGFANDPAAGLRCCMIGENTLYIDNEVYEVGVPTERMPAFLAGLPHANDWPITADSARPETIDYLKRKGFPRIRASKKGANSVEDGLAYLQGLDIVYHPRCVNLEFEFMRYSYKIDKRTEDVVPVPEDKHNHLIDALRYATERLHIKGKTVTYEREDDDRRRRPTDYGGREDDVESYKVV
jgi:phage terminase large subunit